ncbi:MULTISPECIES: DNA polymerase III subunit gamma and tau [unclassified Streptomyces]|uniref:DNA polymerase III subunit gamma and tau n=1 Tax=unclassified Streptomyces TaxID=2593676 RepID=UPI002E145D17|nr:DNA polymerase III subunit gamma and tau [Streptomyces sp. NBC_01197]WSS50239.1 DNA polymerase III subunit gamma and tau [Streptomyces sp. NBC_01180]
MSSLALYRRYRPESFAEVIGQEHVTAPLQQALRNNRVNHAYLFSGPRGCGKTTSARILARCLNCEQGPTPTPCGECQSCQDLARNGPGSIDVIEIDAASHGGVDDARDLREKAFFGPASSRYKIYIIDEAHMVTSAGFNALLKVVEEPPEHLKFIFATTEPEKVIGTIRSRTHHYPFRLVPPSTLRDYLGEVCGQEGAQVADGVLPLVVRAGAGSVRDSMSVMDQLLAGAGEEGVTYAMATALLGYTDGTLLDSVIDAFASSDGAAAFELVDQVIERGNDPRRFVADLLERLRDLVILAAVPDAGEKGLIDAPADVVARMQAQASVFGAAELSRAADLVNTGLTEMRGATSPRLQLELICARVLLPAAFDDERSLQARLDRLERGGAFVPGGQGPAMGYVPGAEAHPTMAAPAATTGGPGGPVGTGGPSGPGMTVAPGTGPAAARAAARGDSPGAGAGGGAAPGAGPAGAPPAPAGPSAEAANAPSAAPAATSAQPAAPAQPPAPASAARQPGAWPGAAAPAAQSQTQPQSQRPAGSWPSATAPGQGQPAQAAPPAASAAPPSAPPAAPAPGMAQGAAQVRNMWPDILEAVKNRRRFTWILLSQNAQVAGFDGTTLQLGFPNSGARDNFASSGSEDVLKQVLADQFHVQWRVDAIVDPSGGTQPPGGSNHPGPGGSSPAPPRPAPQAGGGSAASGPVQQPPAPEPPPRQRPQAFREPEPPVPDGPPPVSLEDDTPEDDDPDLVDSALSGHDLIVRELGATVVEEYTNE